MTPGRCMRGSRSRRTGSRSCGRSSSSSVSLSACVCLHVPQSTHCEGWWAAFDLMKVLKMNCIKVNLSLTTVSTNGIH